MRKINLADQLIENLLILSDQLRFLARRQGMEHGLSVLQVKILHYIDKHPGQKHYATSIKTAFKITNATLSEALKTLKQKKLIQMNKDREDGRKIQLKLTDWGKKVAQITMLYTNPVKNILEPLKKEEQQVLLKNLQGIILKLNATLAE